MERKSGCEYIKNYLGRPLRLALADIIVHQPIDPINYLANYLIKYRHNELHNMVKDIELQELLAEREKYLYKQSEVKYFFIKVYYFNVIILFI